MQLQELVTRYLALRRVREPTIKTYRYYVRRVAEHTGAVLVCDCTVESAIHFRDTLLKTSRPVTWNSARRHLIALWKFAIKIRTTDVNPWRELSPSQVCTKPKTILDEDFTSAVEFMALNPQRFAPIQFWTTLFLTVARTGMRRTQLVGLEWADLNFGKQTMVLRASTSKTHREYTVPMCSALTNDLFALKTAAKALWGESDGFEMTQVFNIGLHRSFRSVERSLTTDRVSHFFLRLSALSNTSLSCHRLRHRIATRLLESDATHVRNVQALLGHTNVTTTLGYVSPNLKAIRAAIESIDE